MGRLILNGLTGLSLLVCLVTVVLWVRGRWYFDYLEGGEQGYVCIVRLGAGRASFTLERFDDHSPRPFAWSTETAIPAYPFEWGTIQIDPSTTVSDDEWRLPGLLLYSKMSTYEGYHVLSVSGFAISYCLIVLLTLILPASRLCFRKRQLPGHCPICHYDLRATRDRCPECGYVPARTADKRQSATENTEHTE